LVFFASQRRQGGADDRHRPEEVHLDHPLPLLGGDVDQLPAGVGAGGGDDGGKVRVALQHAPHRRLCVGPLGQVDHLVVGVEGRRHAVEDHGRASPVGDGARHRRAQAGRRAGDQNRADREIAHFAATTRRR
jgi:hypothetical protein